MKTPRKHAELIHKWADDDSLVIQFKRNHEWLYAKFPSWDDNLEYRIKPEVIRYRSALLKDNGEAWIHSVYTGDSEKDIQQHRCFVKWLTDWIEVEI